MLKLIAIAAMTADHIAWLLFPGYPTDPLPIILQKISFFILSNSRKCPASSDVLFLHS